MSNTSAPVSGTITSGVFPNRNHTTAPDVEQLKRLQARQEHDKATGARSTHPSFTRVGPDNSDLSGVASSNRSREAAETAGTN